MLIATIYSKLAYGDIPRGSQHAVLSGQSLANLLDVIPCATSHLPVETVKEGRVIGYATAKENTSRERVLCISGLAYSDKEVEDSYAE